MIDFDHKPWEKFREHIKNLISDFGDDTLEIISLGMMSEVGKLLDRIQKDKIIKVINKNINHEFDISESIGDVFFYLAAIENELSVFPARNLGLMGKEKESFDSVVKDNTEDDDVVLGIDLSSAITDLVEISASLYKYCIELNLDEIQYYLNKLVGCLMNIIVFYETNGLNCINKVYSKLNNDFDKQYKMIKDHIVTSKSKEAIFKIKFDKRRKSDNYIGIEVHHDNNKSLFKNGSKDIITDFFSAVNFIVNISKDKKVRYLINYDPLFREILDSLSDKIKIYYLINDELLDAEKAKKSSESNKAVPVLINSSIKNLDQLLSHVSTIRKIDADKI
jgi:hypothetical protein